MSASRVKTYQVDVHYRELASSHGQTYAFEGWRYAITVEATRTGKALRAAERLYPGRQLRARLITGQFNGEPIKP